MRKTTIQGEKRTFWQTGRRNEDIYRVGRQYLLSNKSCVRRRRVEKVRVGSEWRGEMNKGTLTRSHVSCDMLRTGESSVTDGTFVVSAHGESGERVTEKDEKDGIRV